MMGARRTRRGFTILEVLIAILILAIGLVAMVALQVAFIQGTTAAADLSTGTLLGERTVEGMRGEAVNWNSIQPSLGTGNTPVLNALMGDGQRGQWTLLNGGYPVNPVGTATDPGATVADTGAAGLNARYCVDARADWLDAQQRVIVGQVRVVWPTEGQAPWLTAGARCAETSLTSVLYTGGIPTAGFNVVYIPFTIRRQSL